MGFRIHVLVQQLDGTVFCYARFALNFYMRESEMLYVFRHG